MQHLITCGKCKKQYAPPAVKTAPSIVQCPACGYPTMLGNMSSADHTIINDQPQQPAGSNPKGWLIHYNQDNKQMQSFELAQGVYTIGRKTTQPLATFCIEDEYVSKIHCTLAVQSQGLHTTFWLYEEQGSTNGTFVNESKQKLVPKNKIQLQHNDTFQIGMSKLVLLIFTNGNHKTSEADKTVVYTTNDKTVII